MIDDCAVAVDLAILLETPDVLAIRQTIAAVRPELTYESDSFRAALLLLVGPGFGFNVDRMAGRTACPRLFVAVCTRRLFDNGVWEHSGAAYAWTSPDDERFWNDVDVATGKLCRRRSPAGRIEWAAPGEWKKKYDYTGDSDAALAVTYICDHEFAPTENTLPAIERPAPDRSKPARARVKVTRAAGQIGLRPQLAAAEPAPSETHFVTNHPLESGVQLFPHAQWL